MNIKKKNKKRVYISFFLLTALSFYLYHGNNTLDVTEFEINSDELSGFRILHLSDLHNKSFGKNQEKIIKKINEIKPDLIVFTGDLVDGRRKGHQNSLSLMTRLAKTYKVYRVNGNHDFGRDGYELGAKLDKLNIITLENTCDAYYYKNVPVLITGVNDPISYQKGIRDKKFKASLKITDNSAYNILLSHRPEYFKDYVNAGYNLALVGHAHGGQIRLPVFGGLIAPHQGFFPAYDAGSYTSGSTTMIVSRGLGNSLFPFRIFNNPELVVIDFKAN